MTRKRGQNEGGISSYATKNGLRWTITWRQPGVLQTDGVIQTKQVRRGGFKTKKAAVAALRDLLASIDNGGYVNPSTITFEQYATRWLQRQTQRLRASTLHSYTRNLRLHVHPVIGAIGIQKIDTDTLDALVTGLLATGRHDGTGGLSARTVRYVVTIVGAILGDAEKRGVIKTNPVRHVERPSSQGSVETDHVVWTADQVKTFLTATAADRRSALWQFLLATGTRRGEALGLRWADLDLDAATCTIVQSLVDVDHGQAVYVQPKTGKGRRTIRLDIDTISALRRLRVVQAAERLQAGASYEDHDLVFARELGQPYHPDRLSKFFVERVAKIKDLPAIRLHDTRHTWATLALRAGVQPHVVQKRLGHSHVSITLSIYAHATPADDGDAAETVAALIR